MMKQVTHFRTLVRAGLIAIVSALVVLAAPGVGQAEESGESEALDWSFNGPFGTFDRAQLQRGYKVYREVCSACHSMEFVSFRNLSEEGGPGFTPEQVKVIASEFEIEDGPNDDGDMFMRPGLLSDRFPAPFPNVQIARLANGGAFPPDLSVLAKARVGGPDYIYALLMGYEEAPAGVELAIGMSYNTVFPNHQIAMPEPIFEDAVEYDDETEPTLENYARDVTAFMMWTAEPKLEARHRMGFKVVLFLLIFAGLLYATKRKVWAAVH